MKKLPVILVIAMLIIVSKVDCFAQSSEARTRELQGEWIVTRLQAGSEIVILSEPPFSYWVEMMIIFDGNNYMQTSKNPGTGIINITERGVFHIESDTILITRDDGVSQLFSYTIREKNLTMRMNIEGEEVVMISRKQ